MNGEHRNSAFLQLNPFGTVPVLEDGDQAITETGAILLHIAERYPQASLIPTEGASRTLALRWLFHAVSIHADFMTWRRAMFKFREDASAKAAVQGWMADRLASSFRTTDQAMTGPFLAGEAPGIADLYMLMVTGWWRGRFAFAAETPRLASAMKAVSALPFVQKAYADQGSELPDFSLALPKSNEQQHAPVPTGR